MLGVARALDHDLGGIDRVGQNTGNESAQRLLKQAL
jgi:hypothetical protein